MAGRDEPLLRVGKLGARSSSPDGFVMPADLAPRTDAPLTHFVSPCGEKSGLVFRGVFVGRQGQGGRATVAINRVSTHRPTS